MRAPSLPLAGTVSVWPASTRRIGRPSSVRATRLSPTRVDLEPGRVGQLALEVGDQGLLVAADRRDVDQLGGAGRRRSVTDRPWLRWLAPWSRRTSLSLDLSWRSPSVSRLMTSTQGRPNSPPGNVRGRVADTATHHGGTTPRLSSSPVSASMTGIELGQDAAGAEHDAVAHPGAVDDDAAAADQAVVADHDRRRPRAARARRRCRRHPTRCTLAPIWAHEPTVAQVSTMVLAPTRAPMLT